MLKYIKCTLSDNAKMYDPPQDHYIEAFTLLVLFSYFICNPKKILHQLKRLFSSMPNSSCESDFQTPVEFD